MGPISSPLTAAAAHTQVMRLRELEAIFSSTASPPARAAGARPRPGAAAPAWTRRTRLPWPWPGTAARRARTPRPSRPAAPDPRTAGRACGRRHIPWRGSSAEICVSVAERPLVLLACRSGRTRRAPSPPAAAAAPAPTSRLPTAARRKAVLLESARRFLGAAGEMRGGGRQHVDHGQDEGDGAVELGGNLGRGRRKRSIIEVSEARLCASPRPPRGREARLSRATAPGRCRAGAQMPKASPRPSSRPSTQAALGARRILSARTVRRGA